MSIKFLSVGTTREIGDACYLLSLNGSTLLLDAGLHPRKEGIDSAPDFRTIRDRQVDAICISHCHLDHLGALPLAMSYFSRANVLMSEASAALAPVMLHHTAKVMRRQFEEGSAGLPLYTPDDIDLISYVFQGIKPDRDFPVFNLSKWADDLTVRFCDAGHILGASGIYVKNHDRAVFYTGDTAAHDQEILPGAVYPDERPDVLILESTLGADPDAEVRNRIAEVAKFARAIAEVIDRKGSVLIPVFSLGRTQEMLATLHRLREKSAIPDVEIYSAGFGNVVSTLYDRTARHTRRRDPSLRLRDLDVRPLPPGDVRKGAHLRHPSIIVVSSGMMARHTMSYKLAEVMLPDPRHGIFFVGYVDPDMPGYQVLTARPGQPVRLGPGSPELTAQCRIQKFHFSAHSHRRHLLDLVERLRPRKVILVHGERGASGWMRETIKMHFDHIDVAIAERGVEIEY